MAMVILLLLPDAPRSRSGELRRTTAPDRADTDRGRTRTWQPLSSTRAHVTDSHNSRGTCGTEFSRVRTLSDLKHILARAAEVLDASGLVVWIGSTTGSRSSRWFPTATPRKWWRGCRPCPARPTTPRRPPIGPGIPADRLVEARRSARRRRAAPRRRRVHRSIVGGDSRGWRGVGGRPGPHHHLCGSSRRGRWARRLLPRRFRRLGRRRTLRVGSLSRSREVFSRSRVLVVDRR